MPESIEDEQARIEQAKRARLEMDHHGCAPLPIILVMALALVLGVML